MLIKFHYKFIPGKLWADIHTNKSSPIIQSKSSLKIKGKLSKKNNS